MFWLFVAYAAIFGMVLGSFLGLAAIRVTAGESVVKPASHCRSCGRALAWYENIPLFSYLFLKGKCRTCSARISPRYFLIELTMALLAVLSLWKLQPIAKFLAVYCLFVAPIVLLIFIDWEWFILPDVVTLPGILVALFLHVADGLLWNSHFARPNAFNLALDSLLGALAGGLTLALLAWLYWSIRKKEGMGGGDVKMAAMIGAFFGWKAIFFIFFLSSLLGIALGLLLLLRRRATLASPLPFGACLGVSALLYLYWGEILLQKYLILTHKLV